jgi:hypothetical protein
MGEIIGQRKVSCLRALHVIRKRGRRSYLLGQHTSLTLHSSGGCGSVHGGAGGRVFVRRCSAQLSSASSLLSTVQYSSAEDNDWLLEALVKIWAPSGRPTFCTSSDVDVCWLKWLLRDCQAIFVRTGVWFLLKFSLCHIEYLDICMEY